MAQTTLTEYQVRAVLPEDGVQIELLGMEVRAEVALDHIEVELLEPTVAITIKE